MKYKPILFGFSWIGILNMLILQWFFIRLSVNVYRYDDRIVSFDVLRYVVPLTGWWCDYIWISRVSPHKDVSIERIPSWKK